MRKLDDNELNRLGLGSLADLASQADARRERDMMAHVLKEIGGKLRGFAQSRGLTTEGPDWQLGAIVAAAFEHPELRLDRRRRGRPKIKGTLAALGQDRRSTRQRELDALMRQIETQRRIMTRQGLKALKDVDVIRGFVIHNGTHPDHPNFAAHVASLQSGLSQARRRVRGERKITNKSRDLRVIP